MDTVTVPKALVFATTVKVKLVGISSEQMVMVIHEGIVTFGLHTRIVSCSSVIVNRVR